MDLKDFIVNFMNLIVGNVVVKLILFFVIFME